MVSLIIHENCNWQGFFLVSLIIHENCNWQGFFLEHKLEILYKLLGLNGKFTLQNLSECAEFHQQIRYIF